MTRQNIDYLAEITHMKAIKTHTRSASFIAQSPLGILFLGLLAVAAATLGSAAPSNNHQAGIIWDEAPTSNGDRIQTAGLFWNNARVDLPETIEVAGLFWNNARVDLPETIEVAGLFWNNAQVDTPNTPVTWA